MTYLIPPKKKHLWINKVVKQNGKAIDKDITDPVEKDNI